MRCNMFNGVRKYVYVFVGKEAKTRQTTFRNNIDNSVTDIVVSARFP